MTAHGLLPLVACLLNVALAGLALVRNPEGRINRVFAALVGALALWNFGVFMLRRSPDADSAYFWEVVIHAAVVVLPAVYYHFVTRFLGRTSGWRSAVTLAYALALLWSVVNLSDSSWFLGGVVRTFWGWAPAAGPLYLPFLVYFNAFLVHGVVLLVREYRGLASSHRRNRIALIVIATVASLSGGLMDFVRFLVARVFPLAEHAYPMGIPANMAFALLLGVSIVRYRLFDVHAAAKRAAVYLVLCAALTAGLVGLTHALADYTGGRIDPLWVVVPLGVLAPALLAPLDHLVQRVMLSRRAGCYETVLALSKRMSGLLDLDAAVHGLVRGLVEGVPVSHAVLMLRTEATGGFEVAGEEGGVSPLRSLRDDSALAQWLRRTGSALVAEEVLVDPALRRHFGADAGELAAVRAAVVVPLAVEGGLVGILFVGEKLSGQIFDAEELEVLGVLAAQAATAIENARLYASQVRLLGETRRQHQEAAGLEAVARAINSSLEREEVFQRIVDHARELTQTDLAYLAPCDPGAGTAAVVAVSGARGEAFRALTVRRGEGAGGRVLDGGEPFWTADYGADARLGHRPDDPEVAEQVAGQAVLPLRFGGAITGLLAVMSRTRREFTPADIAFASRLADQAAIALENSRLYEDLRRALKEVTDSQQRIVQTARLRALGEMAGGVAHDFNNTLAVILGRSQLLRKTTRDPEILRQYDVIEQAARDGARTVQRIQEFTRMRQARPFQPVDLNQVVEGVVEATRSRWKEEAEIRGVRYDVTMRLAPLPPVMGDAAELREALTNLLFNALDAMPQGGAVTLETRSDGSLVRCALADTGSGMPEEVRERAFDPFFTTKGEKGTGLGLAVTYGIISRHGGEIDVVSEPGLGSTFTIRLPAGRETGAVADRAVPRPHRYGRVLVIDDERPVREVLVDMLTAQGHGVETVADGMAALQRLREVDARFDLVMTDLSMPGLSGWEVAKLVERYRPGTPVVLVTGYADRLGAEELRAKGVDYMVAKPFEEDAIQAVVARALAQRDFGGGARGPAPEPFPAR